MVLHNKAIAAIVLAGLVLPLFGRIKMGTPFSDGAVLQRGMEVPVWGTAEPDSTVEVEFGGAKKSAAVGADGSWLVKLPAMEASSESRTMTVREKKKGIFFDGVTDSVCIEDVLVGEVWFASGQSNMECPIWGTATRYRDAKGGIMTTMTRLPNVRYVKCSRAWSAERRELAAEWRKFTPENLRDFLHIETRCGNGDTGISLSAVAFYYARELYLALGIPIGIVDASYGGTNIDAWTPRSGYDGCDESIRETAAYRVSAKWDASMKRPPVTGAHQQPTVLYNGMVASFAPMAMRGFIWYQGCTNSGESRLYCAKLHALYEGWRREFANPGLKFYLVQLAPFSHNWLGICMAQTKFCREEPNAALAVTADAGNFSDIHPNGKEIVAQRLAVHALKRDYGFKIPEDDSPVLKSAEVRDGKAHLVFDNVKDWYVYAPDHSRNPAFELADSDGKWHPAKVVNYRMRKDKEGKDVETDYIDGPEIVLSCDLAAVPVKARYMGQPCTAGTLYNEASLPLGPFETTFR